ncbi:hypothetical protein EBT16_02395 [bacterium]|nr:hypothetical protein [bacterium]
MAHPTSPNSAPLSEACKQEAGSAFSHNTSTAFLLAAGISFLIRSKSFWQGMQSSSATKRILSGRHLEMQRTA